MTNALIPIQIIEVREKYIPFENPTKDGYMGTVFEVSAPALRW